MILEHSKISRVKIKWWFALTSVAGVGIIVNVRCAYMFYLHHLWHLQQVWVLRLQGVPGWQGAVREQYNPSIGTHLYFLVF